MGTIGLPMDWVLRPAIDLELKQYTLLAYLQRVRGRFGEQKLYPYLDELRTHMEELLRLRQGKDELEKGLSSDLMGFDPLTGDPVHAPVERPGSLDVIDAVIDFALPGLREALSEGTELRQELVQRIRFGPVGLLPLRTTEGWLILRSGREARVYGYAMPLLREHREEHQYRSVVTRYVGSYTVDVACTYEHIRMELIGHRGRSLPVPATFVFEASDSLPHIETFMPLAKQIMYVVIGKPS